MGKKRFLVEAPDRIKIFRGNGVIDTVETTARLLQKVLTHRPDYHDPEICFDDNSQITVKSLRSKSCRRRDKKEGRVCEVEIP